MSDYPADLDLDLTLLQEIADGSNEFIVESIEMFIQQTPVSLQDINDALQTADWTAASAAAHKLKATLGFFGMFTSQALIQEIEAGCKNNAPANPTKLIENFKQVQALMAASTSALATIKQETAAKL